MFGSVARGDADEDSDIDVTFPYPEGIGLHTMNRMERQLSELPGVNVDMVPDSALLETVRPSVLADAVPL